MQAPDQGRDDSARVDAATGSTKLVGNDVTTGPNSTLFSDRENGARFLLSMIGEIAFQQEWNVFFILEGAPFQQSERALFTNMFSRVDADNDYRIYARTGLTYKF